MSAPRVSVVSLTWNSERFIEPFLRTLIADIHRSDFQVEVIILDNGSTDGTAAALRRVAAGDPRVQVVFLGKNFGTTVSRNIGIRMSAGETVFILDSDTEIPLGTLAGLVCCQDSHESAGSLGLICPRLTYPDGEFQESARRFPTLLTKAYRLLRLEDRRRSDETVDGVIAGHTVAVDYAISAAWFVPRAVFDQVGLLDEEIFYAPEDVEFCARLWANNLQVWYYPEVTVVHNCQRLTNKRPFSKLGASHLKGLVYYWWKYRGFFTRRLGPSAGT
ncbi:MAG: hypothetical protein RJA70_1729 [Pseudomonadota bacterium]|jgi:GT2 family glycosyltransferase